MEGECTADVRRQQRSQDKYPSSHVEQGYMNVGKDHGKAAKYRSDDADTQYDDSDDPNRAETKAQPRPNERGSRDRPGCREDEDRVKPALRHFVPYQTQPPNTQNVVDFHRDQKGKTGYTDREKRAAHRRRSLTGDKGAPGGKRGDNDDGKSQRAIIEHR